MKSITKLLGCSALLVALLCFNLKISYSQTTRNAGTNAELTNAVTASSDGDIINVTNDIVVSGAIAISKTVTINGNSFTISVPVPGLDDEGIFAVSPSAFRVFTITGVGKTITLNNMTIKGGANISGAGINITSATVKLNYVIICDCYGGASNGGGGIYNSSGKLFFNNVQLIRNAARYGGGFVNAGGTMFVENSSFSENRSTGTNGGGGGGENNGGGTIYMNNSTFSNNKSTEIGGGINNYGGTLWICNSSFTGNVGYGSTTSGGAIGMNGGTANIINCIFVYNYIRSAGTYTNPTAYTLSDVSKFGGSETINSYYNIYHSTVASNVSISNIAFGGNANGSDNSIFTNGLLTKLTDGTGAVLGTGEVFQPFLISLGNTGAITLKSGSFALQAANLGTQTGFYNNNGSNPIVGYYNGTSWVTLAGANAQNYVVNTDQFGTTRTNPPTRGSVEAVVDNAYMLKINKAANGTVNGGSLYGDIYASGTTITLIAIPNSGYTFTRWDYVVGGSGTASTNNPFDILVNRNITLIPVFTASVAGHYNITYIGNGNTGGTEPATANFTSSTTIAGPGDLVNTGYTFGSWNTHDNGSGLTYNTGATYSLGTNLTLYAQWIQVNMWTAGAGSADWNNPANWSDNAVPDMNADVMIPSHPSGGNIFPSVYVANAVCKSITIQTGASLNVNSGKNIAVYGDLANSGNAAHGNGTFTFCGSAAQTISGANTFANLTINNASGISLTGNTEVTEILTPTAGTINTNNKLTLIADARKFGIISGSGSGTVSGNVNVQKQFLSYKRYFYISAPVTCTFQQVQNFITITGWNASYKIGQWSNVWKYDETDIAQVSHPYGVRMNGWIAPSSLSDALEPFKGYALYVDAVKTTKLTLNGAVNNGPISIPVSNTSSVGNGGDHMDDGWNLVGNPYPCPINWESGAGWSKNNIDNAIYSYDGKCYKTFVNGIGVPSDVNGIIAPMQGFYIHASANSTLAINNAARVNSCTPNFYKKAEEKQLIRIKAFNKAFPEDADETVLYFNENSTKQFNNLFDALKIMNTSDNVPNIYSISDDNKKLSIFALPLLTDNELSIPLGLKALNNGNFQINASEISNVDANTEIYIVDILNNVKQDLRLNPIYDFSANSGVTEGRLFLNFNAKSTQTAISKENENNIFYTFTSGRILNLSYSNSLNKEAMLQIYNLVGQEVIQSGKINNGNYKFDMENGIYIVKLIADNKTYTKKIFIK